MSAADAIVPSPGTSGSDNPAAARGGGRGRGRRGSGRGRGDRSGSGRGNENPRFGNKTGFKGNTDGMKGNVFQCPGENTDKQQFLKTVGVLKEHIEKTFKFPQDVATICTTHEIGEVKMPATITKKEYEEDMSKKMLWEIDMKTYKKRVDELESNKRAIYAIVWGQSSPSMQSKLESLKDYARKSIECDCVWLLKEIMGITHQFEGTRNIFLSLDDAWSNYYALRQESSQTLNEYLKIFQSMVQVLEHYGAGLGAEGPYQESVMRQVKMDAVASSTIVTTEEMKKLAIAAAKKKCVAIAFLKRADRKRYGGLWNDLENSFTRGLDQYPEDLTGAYNLLLSYKAHPNFQVRKTNEVQVADESVTAMTFLQNGTVVPGTDGVTHARTKCYSCNSHGHYASDCPTENQGTKAVQLLQTDSDAKDTEQPYRSEFTFMHIGQEVKMNDEETVAYNQHEDMFGYAFNQNESRYDIIPSDWILLDSQSTVSVFKNKELLDNIRQSKKRLIVYTNGGTQTSTEMGTVKIFGDVWFNKDSLAYILSMAEVRKECRITMDTSVEASINVHRKNGTVMKFKEYDSGLYYYDAGIKAVVDNNNSSNSKHNAYIFVNTVAGNKMRYTRREIEKADLARALYRKLGHPSERDFNKILQSNLIRNCPITSDDAKRAMIIYGPDILTVKGKAVKRQNNSIPAYQPILVPEPIITQYSDIRLFVDIFWVNGTVFLHTISQFVKFRTVARIINRQKNTLLMELRAIINLYQTRGFNILRIEADREFACITNDLLPTPLNVADADDHVHEVERSIRTVKERTRCTLQGLPFRRVPKLMIRAAVEGAHRSLNQFPANDGISDVLSPLTIMTGCPNINYNDLTIEIGPYAMVYEDNDPKNTTRTRATGAIALNPTGNAQGGYFFMSLVTGAKLSRQQWDEIPMPDGVIAAVEAMALEQVQPLIGNTGPIFEWSPGILIQDEIGLPEVVDLMEDEVMDVLNGDINENDNIEPENLVEEENEEEELSVAEEELSVADAENMSEENSLHDYTDSDHMTEDEIEDSASEDVGSRNADENNNVEFEERVEVQQNPAPENSSYNLRPNRNRGYAHRLDHQMDDPDSSKSYDTQFVQHGIQFLQHGNTETMPLRDALEHMQTSGTDTEVYKCVVGFIMTQMSAKAGIKKYGKVAVDALFNEFLQLHDLGVFVGKMASDLTKAQRRAALRAISVIKEKRCGKIKGRTVADGSVQKNLYSKEETSSATLSTDALMMSVMIDACEHRDVAIADVAGAYLHATLPDFTLLKVEGESVDIMCKVNEVYEKFVAIENGKRVLYLQLLKALYGCVKSALLWYELFAGLLTDMGFKLNPYDMCVANKEINGKQCTITWFVDDNKISHVDPEVVTSIINKIEERFGKMLVKRGKEHVFLGMNITYNDDSTVTIGMKDYVLEAMADLGEAITRSAATPAKRDLFEINDKSIVLVGEQKEKFHSIVAKLLYVSKRCRLDIQLSIAFLCTRVSCSTEQDWNKLRRVLEYLHGTIDECLILGCDDITKMKTWVDSSYAVHNDLKSHTGGTISFGRGAVMSKSSKQNLNTKSSTEAELVGASDYLPHAIWGKKFLESQGYSLTENTFYQDNMSTIQFAKNERKSCGQNSRHIDI